MKALEWIGIFVIVVWAVVGTIILLLGWGYSGGSFLHTLRLLIAPDEEISWSEYLGNLLLLLGAWPTLAALCWLKRPLRSP